MATLETAGAMVVVLTVIFSGIGLWDYLDLVQETSFLVDKYAYDIPIKPFYIDDNGNISPRLDKVDDYIVTMLENIVTEIQSKSDIANSEDNYFIEASYSLITINQQDGSILGISPLQSAIRGSLAIGDLDQDLSSIIADRAMQQQATDLYGNTPSVLAIPIALPGINSTNKYFPSSIVLGLKVYFSLEDSFVGRVAEWVTEANSVGSFKTVTLRGELE